MTIRPLTESDISTPAEPLAAGADLRLLVISFKECWQDEAGRWCTHGGFPLQMKAISRLFDHTTFLLTESPFQDGGTPLPDGAEVIRLPRPAGSDLRRKLWIGAHLPGLLQTLQAHVRAADVVHTPLPGDIPLLGMVVALRLRKRVIARYGGSWEETSQTTAMNRLTKRLMARNAGGRNVMLVSGLGDPARPPAPGLHWLMTTAIEESDLESVRPDLYRPPHDPLRLVYAGRFSPEKGLPVLLRALGMLKAAYSSGEPPLQVHLIGDGPQRAELLELAARWGLGEWVRFTGMQPRAALYRLFLAADACVLPSLTESFGKTRIEAMLAGLPVLTTEVGFGRQIVGADGERGWLAPSGDAAALAERLDALTRLRDPGEWAALRRRCRAYAERFTLEDWTAAIGRICAEQWKFRLVGGKLTP
ncbi:MAG TPA: glycosyltransferase family 4 protein [Anaerolineaceae bacterium]|nr:glycosyltransferase family 4 protein [Anaerolineaceae bacterium]